MNYTIIYGSVREKRLGIRAVNFIKSELEMNGETVSIIDPKQCDIPLLDKMYKEYPEGTAPKNLEIVADILRKTDAFIILTGEYNHSVPPALSNLIDHFMKEYFWRPAGIVSYSAGSFGGVRAAVHLRALLGEVGLITIPSMMPIPKIQTVFDETGKAIEERYHDRFTKFYAELKWYTEALKAQREKGTPY
jgi:NAD(P)H-dependent FMN reductase